MFRLEDQISGCVPPHANIEMSSVVLNDDANMDCSTCALLKKDNDKRQADLDTNRQTLCDEGKHRRDVHEWFGKDCLINLR